MELMISEAAPRKTQIGSEYFDILEERGHVGVWTWDLATESIDWSAGLYRLLGLVPGSVQPTREFFHSLVHPDDRPLQVQRGLSMREGLALSFDVRVIRPNGSVRWLATKTETISDREGRAVRVVGVVFDITARKHIEGALDASKDRFRALALAVDGIVWTAQGDGTLEVLSDPKGLACREAEHFEGPWISLIAPEDRDEVWATWQEAQQAGSQFMVDCHLAAQGLSGSLYSIRAMPVRDASGEYREWMGICRDVGLGGLDVMAPEEQPQVTGPQIRAARGILNWSVRQLAEAAGVSVSTIRRLEELPASPPSFEPKLKKVQEALVHGGVEFIFPRTGKPAARPA